MRHIGLENNLETKAGKIKILNQFKDIMISLCDSIEKDAITDYDLAHLISTTSVRMGKAGSILTKKLNKT